MILLIALFLSLPGYALDQVNSASVVASATIGTTASVKVVAANARRVGLLLYNNSANSVYIKYGSAGDTGNDMTVIIPTFATWMMPTPVYTGILYGKRNAGTGSVVATELTN